MSDALMSAAVRYAQLGWYIFPLRKILTLPDGSKSCTCKAGPRCTAIGKHPAVKWKTEATCDPGKVREWWGGRFKGCGIGCATGPSGLLVADADGPAGILTMQGLLGAGRLVTARTRTARGWHIFFRGEAPTSSDPDTKLDIRSIGGYVVLPPSPHASGHVYTWEAAPWDTPVPEAPPTILAYARAKKKPARGGQLGRNQRGVQQERCSPEGEGNSIILPDYLACAIPDFSDRLDGLLNAPDWTEVRRALAHIPPDCKMDAWIRVGMALHQASKGAIQGLDIWDEWSARGGDKYKGREETEYKWTTFKQDPDGVGIGSLFAIAKEHGYNRLTAIDRREVMSYNNLDLAGFQQTHETRPPDDVRAPGAVDSAIFSTSGGRSGQESGNPQPAPTRQEPETASEQINGAHAEFFAKCTSESDNPLIKLNKEFAVIGNVGGKCLVLSWEDSPLDEKVKVPAFQNFKSFSERFANQYVTIKKTRQYKGGAEEEFEEAVQLGAHWLKWPERRTYRAMELRPNAPQELPNGNFNLWQGWGVTPRPGRWPLMREHIRAVLAAGNGVADDYILRWAAWCVQNPDRPAGAALVLRGGKGSGKGVFLRALRRIFGAHGLQIFQRAHLVGTFNAHMRNCLYLFADEAYWAGDKQGESAIKGLITEPAILLEQKGVDAVAWPNRVKVAMAANAAWVVPASADERRYAVFDVSNDVAQNESYFRPLFAEIASGGLSAMLHDLLHLELGDWHPQAVPITKALQDQKGLSLSALDSWWLGLLQGHGEKWMEFDEKSQLWTAASLMEAARASEPALQRVGDIKIASFLRDNGAIRFRQETGSKWQLPSARDARTAFEAKFGVWDWEEWKGAEK